MSYIQPKTDFKDGDILYGIDLNASNAVIKAGVDDNFDRIQGLNTDKQDKLTAGTGIDITDNVISSTSTVADWGDIEGNIEDQSDLKDALDAKQDVIDSSNKLDYSLLDNTPTIPSKTSDLTNDSGFIDNTYHDSTKQDTLTAGTGIQIENNVISNTQTSAEWGNITGNLADQTDLNDALGDKVDKVQGKGLSTEDYTSADKTKLSGIETGAEENTIETVKVDGTALTPDSDKAVNIDLSGKQDTLVSGTNIKTVNNYSLLGSGNIDISGGGGSNNQVYHVHTNNENDPFIIEGKEQGLYQFGYINNGVLGRANIHDLKLKARSTSTNVFSINTTDGKVLIIRKLDDTTENDTPLLFYTDSLTNTITCLALRNNAPYGQLVHFANYDIGSAYMPVLTDLNQTIDGVKTFTSAPKSSTTPSASDDIANKDYVDTALENKVDKVTGKQLSTNDYTTEEKTKLTGIETGAEVNDIDTIKVNGTTQTITSKAVDITVPTKTSDLTNDSNFVESTDLSTVATSGSYSDLSNKPTIPTKLSDLTNDNNTVTDASYVHTDNNYTSAEKTKLAGIEAGAQVNVSEIAVGSTTTADTVLQIESEDLDFQGLDTTAIVDLIYPVGSIYMSVNSANPSVLFGGTWAAWGSGRVPVGIDTNDSDFNTVEKTGGSKTDYLSNVWAEIGYYENRILMNAQDGVINVNRDMACSSGTGIGTQIGNHTKVSGSVNKLQPYITCYMWKRTA